MAKLLKVMKVEMRETVTETVRKSKRHDYARGGYKIEETIQRVTSATPFALLECGHWRQEHNYGAVVSTAERLSCHVCEQAELNRKRAEKESSNVFSTAALRARPDRCGITWRTPQREVLAVLGVRRWC